MTTVRTAALILAAALAVHQARFIIAGHGAGGEAAGHAYLPLAGTAVALLLAGAAAQLLALLARARATGRAEDGPLGFGSTWLLSALAIALAFTCQELLEGLLAPGRADGLAAVAGDGGWVAYPLALGAGVLVSIGLRVARAAVVAAARGGRRSRVQRARRPRLQLPRGHRLRAGALALHLSGRAPPLTLR